MKEITKVSDITHTEVAEYLRLVEVTEADNQTLENLIEISKSYITNYTGHTEAELDEYKDMVIVVFILCQDMWDNRALYVDNTNLNRVVETILNMHSHNLLPQEEGGADD